MNVLVAELRAARRSTVTWTVALVAVAALMLALYPSFAQNVTEVQKLLSGMPLPIRKAVGLSVELIGSLPGFYSFVLTYVLVAGAVQATGLGVRVIARDAIERTEDFLLTKPVSRPVLLAQKLLAALLALLATNAVFLPASLLVASTVSRGPLDVRTTALLSATLLLVQLVCLAVGVCIAALAPRIRSVHTVALSTVFAFFLLNMLSTVIDEEYARYLTPFQYVRGIDVVRTGAYELRFVLAALAVVVAALTVSFTRYTARDVPA